MKKVKYGSQIIWDYSISQKKDNKFNKIENAYRNKNSSFNSFNGNPNVDKLINNEFNNNNSNFSMRKLTFNIYYIVLFLSLFGFVFLLGINIVHASVINSSEHTINFTEDSGESLSILRNYVLNPTVREKKRDKFSLPEQIIFYKYRVKKNDSFEKIAKSFNLKVDTLYLINNITTKRVLKIGEILKISNQNGRLIKVSRNDSISKIANRFGVSWKTIVDINGLTSSTIHPGEKLFIAGSMMSKYEKRIFYNDVKKFIWPLTGRITSPFGPRKDPITGVPSFHNGIDIKAQLNSTVRVARNGKIVFIGWSNIYGKYMLVKHKGGYITGYAHLNKVLVKKNQWVNQGDIIAKSGSTGRSTGPHLHFEVRKNGKCINPLLILK